MTKIKKNPARISSGGMNYIPDGGGGGDGGTLGSVGLVGGAFGPFLLVRK